MAASGSSPETHTFEQASAIFNSPDADLEIQCAPASDTTISGSWADDGKEYIFKVHRTRLAAISTFFQDMIDTAGPQQEAEYK